METQSRTAELIHHNCSLELSPESDSENKSQKGLQNIVFGKYEIGVWYSSPYSNEFQSCLKLFICEFCLKCMNSSLILKRHKAKCPLNGPPGLYISMKSIAKLIVFLLLFKVLKFTKKTAFLFLKSTVIRRRNIVRIFVCWPNCFSITRHCFLMLNHFYFML